jgi:hypothetical protein
MPINYLGGNSPETEFWGRTKKDNLKYKDW